MSKKEEPVTAHIPPKPHKLHLSAKRLAKLKARVWRLRKAFVVLGMVSAKMREGSTRRKRVCLNCTLEGRSWRTLLDDWLSDRDWRKDRQLEYRGLMKEVVILKVNAVGRKDGGPGENVPTAM